MLDKLLTADTIRVVENVESWEDAIKVACKPLVDNKSVESRYIDAIIESTKELGPYYVIGPHMAMPHAAPDRGVNKLSLSLLVVKNGVEFGSDGNDPVNLIVILAATDNNSHVDTMGALADFFMNEEDVQHVCATDSIEEILEVIKKY